MEWLFSHPEDLAIAPAPAAAAPEQAAGDAQQLKLSPAQVGHFIKLFWDAQAATNLASLAGHVATFLSWLDQADQITESRCEALCTMKLARRDMTLCTLPHSIQSMEP